MKRLFTLFLALSLFAAISTHAQTDDTFTPEQKFLRTMQLLRTAYVDSVNMEKLVEYGISMMLEHLDPHSVYMTAEEVQRSNEPLQGNFEGIGIQFQIIRDTVHVISTISGGPSEEVGIMGGDKIVAIDGEAFVGAEINNTVVTEKLRGKKGTKVIVGIVRYPSTEIIEFEIIRDKIPIYSIDAAFMLNETTGYIKINRFSNTTMDEFADAMKKLKELNMKELIIDLRNNSGGYLRTAIDLTDQFFDRDKLIVYTEGVNMSGEKYFSTSKGEYKTGKLIVLVDQGSASASEIFAGAIQDLDRGIVLGRRTFGKGLVQKPYSYPDGSAVRLTTARYYTPTGRCIQKPYDEDKSKYINELNDRLESGELLSIDSVHFPDSLKYTTPGGRIVYGGGGVMPDIYVPLDTTRLSEFYIELTRKNIINQFIGDYMQTHRKQLKNEYQTLRAFKLDYIPKIDELVAELVVYATNAGLEPQEMDSVTREFLGYIVVAQIARQLFDQSAYYEIIIDIDNEIIRALEVMKDDSYFKGLNY